MDTRTKKYFDNNLPTYSLAPYKDSLRFLTKKKAILLDVGCAEGSGMKFLAKHRKYKIYGLESSSMYQAKKVSDQKVYHFSILDDQECMKLEGKFDYVLMMRVLHHLVGKTIGQSSFLERKAVDNAMLMLKDGGRLFVSEPIYNPSFFNTFVFYIKRAVAIFTDKRVHLGGYRFNIGLPIVSYFSLKSARYFFSHYCVENFINKLENKGLLSKVTRRSDLIVIIKK